MTAPSAERQDTGASVEAAATGLIEQLAAEWGVLRGRYEARIEGLATEVARLSGRVAGLERVEASLRDRVTAAEARAVELEAELRDRQRAVTLVADLRAERDDLAVRRDELEAELARALRLAERYRERYQEAELRRQTLALAVESGRGVFELQSQLVTALEWLDRSREHAALMTGLLEECAAGSVDAALAARIAAAIEPPAGAAPAEPVDGPMRVLSISPDLGLIVVGGGRDRGLVLGARLVVLQEGRSIASARVVDLRERVAGALLEPGAAPGIAPRVGDEVRRP